MKKKNYSNKFLLLWYSYPRVAIGVVLLAINLFVIILFTLILSLVSGNDFFNELAYLFTYTMCSDGIYDFVNQEDDLICFIIKIILTIIQMVIFSGALIGFTTDIIQNAFDNRLENKGKMYLKNHFVFLNWSTIGQNIIHDLSFLDGDKTVVILTDDNREDVINSIDNVFIATGKKRKNLRIFVKKGEPTSLKHLSDISIKDAKYVGILLPNQEDNNLNENEISTKDLTAFKLTLLMLGEAPNANIVVETEKGITKEKIELLINSTHPEDKQRVAVFSHNSIMGHILGRTTVNPLFEPLFQHILSFDGVEFYCIPTMDLEEALYSYNNCIPVINYDDDDVIDADGNKATDQLYILSEREGQLGERNDKKSFVKPLKYNEQIKPEDFTLFIFSDSNSTSFVVNEIINNNTNYNTNIRYKILSYNESMESIVDKIKDTPGKRKLLLLSKEKCNVNEQDTDIFLLLLYLKSNMDIKDDIEIYVELVNINNLTPVKNLGIATVILTNKIISLYMVQLLTHRGSEKFFNDILFTNSETGDIDMKIIPAEQLLEFDGDTLDFSCYSELVQSFFIASSKKKMLIGYFPENSEEGHFFCNDMDKKRDLSIRPKDRLIFATYG